MYTPTFPSVVPYFIIRGCSVDRAGLQITSRQNFCRVLALQFIKLILKKIQVIKVLFMPQPSTGYA